MMKCPKCGTENQDQVKFCRACGNKFEYTVPSQAQNPVNAFPHDISAIWPEWQVEKQIGKGAYGVVYHAVRRDNNVESTAAIKVISIPSNSSEIDSMRSEGLDLDGTRTYFKGIVDGFIDEIRLMESLKGVQNIVSVEDYKVVEKKDSIGWDIYIRMELLTPFNTYIQDKKFDEAEVIKLGSDICTALEVCAKRNVIHRDIKPENIFVNDFGYFKLGDFGIARKLENVTGGLSQKGTLNYMAPEVANGTEYDARVDIYSLGVMLYRLMNGNRLPFIETDQQLLSPNERRIAMERRIRGEALPAPCNASPEMADLILRACAYNPNIRFATATEMKQALASVANGTYQIKVEEEFDQTTVLAQPQDIYDGTVTMKLPATAAEATPVASEVKRFGDTTKKKKMKVKIIAIAVAAVLLLTAMICAISFFTGAPYSTYKYLKDGKHSKAVSTYRSGVKGNSLNEAIMKSLLDGEVKTAAEKFSSGEWDYNDAKDHLEALDDLGFDDAVTKLEEITELYANDIIAKCSDGSYTYDKAKSKIDELSKSGYKNVSGKIEELTAAYVAIVVRQFNDDELTYDEANNALVNIRNMYSDAYAETTKGLSEIREAYASEVVEKYKQGKTKYNDALEVLNSLKADGYTDVSNMIEEITALENSNEFFENGKEYFDDGNYKDAIIELSKIPENSKNYEEVLKLIEEASNKYFDQVLITIGLYIDMNDYVQALNCFDDTYELIPDSVDTTDIDDAKAEFLADYKSFVLELANDYSTNGDYFGAYKVVNDVLEVFDNDESLSKLAKSYEDAYINGVLSKVEESISNGDFSSAEDLLNEATENVGNNESLSDKKEEIANTQPVSITTLTPITNAFNWNQGAPEDPFGNNYSSDCNYAIFNRSNSWGGEEYVAEYRVYKKYSTLSLKLAPYTSCGAGDSHISYVQVFADDKLVYTTTKVGKRNDAMTIKANITGAEYIKIKVTVSEGAAVIISNVMLSTAAYQGNSSASGVSVTTFPVISNAWNWNKGAPESRTNVDYTVSQNYAIFDRTNSWGGSEYVTEFRAGKKYTTISGTVAPYVNCGSNENHTSYIQIYADNNLVYTSEKIGIYTETVKFSVNINEADYIKVVINVAEDASAIVSDVLCHK